MASRSREAKLEAAIARARALVRNTVARMPGKRPRWVVLELSGMFPARTRRLPFGLPLPPELRLAERSLEDLDRDVASLAEAPWLEGVVLSIQGLHVTPATAYALRSAVEVLRRAGKRTVAYVPHLDAMSYWVASAAETIAAPESADVTLLGFALSVTFAREALDRLGVRFEKLAIGEYKNAFDELVRKDMSPAQREQYEALLASVESRFVSDVAAARRLAPEQVRRAVDEGIASAEQARELGLVDRVAYEDELLGPEHAPFDRAARFLRVPEPGDDRIALVSILGGIMPGKSRRAPVPLPMLSGFTGAESVVRSLRAAEADEATRAVVLYVDSPGGSSLASDLVWREVRRLAQKKPIVAVMGAVAASGGYYVASAASRIIAAPVTITGSIGVLTGKLVVDGFFERHGLHAEHVARGRFALLHRATVPFGEAERALLERQSRDVYDRFVRRVAEGRGLTDARVDELGRGRVWSGADAMERGLVDELGDVRTGIERARELAGASARATVWNVPAPREVLLPNAYDSAAVSRLFAPWLREVHWLVGEPFVTLA